MALDKTAYMLYNKIMDYTVVFYQDENGCSQPLDYLKSLNRKYEAKPKNGLLYYRSTDRIYQGLMPMCWKGMSASFDLQ